MVGPSRIAQQEGFGMSELRTFRSYEEFFNFYLGQHSNPANRWMHAIGTLLGLLVAIIAFATRHPWYALLWIPLGYGFAWTGHFLLEKNQPATFGHPFWAFISDFRMLGLMLIGRLSSRIKAVANSIENS
jgi:hypothetical protein